MYPSLLLAFLVTKMCCWLVVSLLFPRVTRVLSAQLLPSHLSLPPVLVHGVTPAQEQNFVLAIVEVL